MQHHWEKLASGTVRVHSTAEQLMEQAFEYFKWSDAHPIRLPKTVMTGKEAGRIIETVSVRPYSVKAFCVHAGISEEYLRDIRQTKDKTSLYYIVVSRILYIIYTQNIEMAIIQEYSTSLVSMVLNLNKEDVPTSAITVNVVQGLPELSKSENEILEKLEMENALLKNTKEQNG